MSTWFITHAYLKREYGKKHFEIEESLKSEKRSHAMAKMKIAQSDSNWNEFSMIFGEVNPNFITLLTTEFPDLTKGELRLACLVHLGVETKEIARMLSVSPETVKRNRVRLRAKLKLQTSEKLEGFLREIAIRANKNTPGR